MNSIEFIEKEIESIQKILNDEDSPFKKDNTFWSNKLNHLQQIKTEIEAWEVVKEHCVYQDDDVYNCIQEGFYIIKPIRGKDFLIVRKALKVEDEKED